jgi:tRNA (mo5U34)-methyltransferase
MIDAAPIRQMLALEGMQPWAELIERQLDGFTNLASHGDWARWWKAVEGLPTFSGGHVDCADGALGVFPDRPPDTVARRRLLESLEALHPWRKGPYRLGDIRIETEWRSDWKWNRVSAHLQPLHGRLVLDVGCGNGYHCWRMAGAGARLIIGIDPTQRYLAQFLAIRHFLGREWPVYLLPFASEALPHNLQAFDTVFSMGILYHRRSPIDHLLELKGFLRSGGELILETLVIEGPEGSVLVPEGRYAKMRNVWFIPSPATLAVWLKRCGFRNVNTVDVSVTSLEEQRSTDWMRFESLWDFLNPDDRSRTLEGYPAPRRAILTAVKP